MSYKVIVIDNLQLIFVGLSKKTYSLLPDSSASNVTQFVDSVISSCETFDLESKLAAFTPEIVSITISGGGYTTMTLGIAALSVFAPIAEDYKHQKDGNVELNMCGVSGGAWGLVYYLGSPARVNSDESKKIINRVQGRYNELLKNLPSQSVSLIQHILQQFEFPFFYLFDIGWLSNAVRMLETKFDMNWEEFIQSWLFDDFQIHNKKWNILIGCAGMISKCNKLIEERCNNNKRRKISRVEYVVKDVFTDIIVYNSLKYGFRTISANPVQILRVIGVALYNT